MKRYKTILAIDPGKHYGWAYQDSDGIISSGHIALKEKGITPKAVHELHTSLAVFFSGFNIIIGPLLDLIVYEYSNFQIGNAAARSHGMFVTCLILRARTCCKEIKYALPSEIKKHALGKGRGTKEEMIRYANSLGQFSVHDTITDHNEADAVCLLDLFRKQE